MNGTKTLIFTGITILEILVILLASYFLPKVKKTMLAMILALGNMAVFLTHVIYNPQILGGNVSFLGSSGGGSVHLGIWDGLGFRIMDFIKGEEIHTLVTSLFVHANIMHLLMNMLALLLLGVPFEEKIGARNLAIIFFGAGIGAALINTIYYLSFPTFLHDTAAANGIGASGAVFGVLGAFVALYPRDKVIFPLIIIRPWPVYVIALIYGGLESLAVMGRVSDGVGHFTHLNGLIIGILLAILLKKSGALDDKEGEKDVRFSVEALRGIARNEEEKEIIEKIEKAEIPDVRKAWLEHLMEMIKCPECGGNVDLERGGCGCGKTRIKADP